MIKKYDGNDKLFLKACELAEIKTVFRRQFKKWTKKYGKAYSRRQEAQEQLNNKE